jgi:hypothetical protein
MMNNPKLQDFARKSILEGLQQLPEGWQDRFKLMYGRDNGKRGVEDTHALSMADVVRGIPAESLDWALTQVDNSLAKLERSAEPADAPAAPSPAAKAAPAGSALYEWLVKASRCGLPTVEQAAQVLKDYYEGAGPEPALPVATVSLVEAATGEDASLDAILGWVCVHKDGGEPQFVKLADRKLVAMRRKLPNTWHVHTVTARGAMHASPAWCAALADAAISRLQER